MTFKDENPNSIKYTMIQRHLEEIGERMERMIRTQSPLPCMHQHHDKIINSKHEKFNLIFCYDCQCYCDGFGQQMSHYEEWK